MDIVSLNSLSLVISPVCRHNEWECDVFISLKFVHLTKVREWFAACSYSHVNDLQAHGRALGDGVRWSEDTERVPINTISLLSL